MTVLVASTEPFDVIYHLLFTPRHGDAFSFVISFLLDEIVLFLEVECIS